MGNTRKMMVYKRRLDVKKMYLQGSTVVDIARSLNVSESVVRNDLITINKQYMKAVQTNGHILEKQAEYILKHLEQLEMVKAKLWEIEKDADSDKSKVMALRAVLDELSHEAKVLRLIDVSKTINNYIHVDKINVLVNQIIDVIKEFVPVDKQKYAFSRLKQMSNVIDIQRKVEG